MDFIEMTLTNINSSYKLCMNSSDLEQFMLSGEIKPGYEGQVMHLLDETPTLLIEGAVTQLATDKNINPKQIWMNLANVAIKIHLPNKFWETV